MLVERGSVAGLRRIVDDAARSLSRVNRSQAITALWSAWRNSSGDAERALKCCTPGGRPAGAGTLLLCCCRRSSSPAVFLRCARFARGISRTAPAILVPKSKPIVGPCREAGTCRLGSPELKGLSANRLGHASVPRAALAGRQVGRVRRAGEAPLDAVVTGTVAANARRLAWHSRLFPGYRAYPGISAARNSQL